MRPLNPTNNPQSSFTPKPTTAEKDKVIMDTRRLGAYMNSTVALGLFCVKKAPMPLKFFGAVAALGAMPASRDLARIELLPRLYDYLGDDRSKIAIQELNTEIAKKRVSESGNI